MTGSLISRWKSSVYDTWLHPRHLALSLRRRRIRQLAGSVGGRLLDVGCGRKPHQGLFPSARSYIGVDLPWSMHGRDQVDVFGSALALPFGTGSFDSLLSTEVLEHTEDPATAIMEMARVLRPEGLLILTAPLSEPLHEEPHDYFRFTKYGLGFLLNRAGLSADTMLPVGGTWAEIGQRLSTFFFLTIGSLPGEMGERVPRSLLGPPVVILCAVIQILASALESVWHDEAGTMGYAVLAIKRSDAGDAAKAANAREPRKWGTG